MTESAPRRGRGRPRLEPHEKKSKKSSLTLDGPIPDFINATDCLELLRQYRGRGLDYRRFRYFVEIGEIPSYVDRITTTNAGFSVRRFKWEEVRRWLDSTLVAAKPTKGIVVNGKFQPAREPQR